jgi:hypothetical protein
MNASEEAFRLLGGVGMKIRVFSGDASDCRREINNFFERQNCEFHSITTAHESSTSSYGKLLVIITYSEIK